MKIYWAWNSPKLFGPWSFVGTKGERTYGIGGKAMIAPQSHGTQFGVSLLAGRWCLGFGFTSRIVVTKRLRRPTHG